MGGEKMVQDTAADSTLHPKTGGIKIVKDKLSIIGEVGNISPEEQSKAAEKGFNDNTQINEILKSLEFIKTCAMAAVESLKLIESCALTLCGFRKKYPKDEKEA
jgi:hypothetical protein